ncbi:MAG: glycyl-radical enzyme activating protein [Bryobacteraceae bacterium]|jgi:pyruvate formate lyase activating enzyme
MRYSTQDGPGIRTTVFFKGCPLSCWWCHNPESQSSQPELLYFEERCRHCGDCLAACPEHAIEQVDGIVRTSALCRRCGHCTEVCQAEARQIAGRRLTISEILTEIEKDLVFFEESRGGVTLSGGEPLAQPRVASALLGACRELGIGTVLETCGYAPSGVFLDVALGADLVLFDLKLMDPARHKQYTGVSNRRILRNLEELVARGRAVTVRIPVMPGINDAEDEIRHFARYLAALPASQVELLPYHHIGAGKYQRLGLTYRLRDARPPAEADLARFSDALARAGVSVRVRGQS